MTRVSPSYVAKRLAASVFVVWVLLTILFVLVKLLPGGLSQQFLTSELGSSQTENVKSAYALGENLLFQYVNWLISYATLNFGYSTQTQEPVLTIIARRLPRTVALFGTAFLINYTLGTVAGIYFGWDRGTLRDKIGFVVGLTSYSIPFFWIAWMLLLVFAFGDFGFRVFPLAHMTTPFKAEYTGIGLMVDILHHLVLPALSLVIVGWAGAMLITRTSMQETVNKPYIKTARAKGLSEPEIKYKHAARNALIPVVTQGIVAIAFIFDGAVVVETVFSWPGMGALLVDAVLADNYPVAMATFYMLGVLIIALRFVTDLLYTYLDPRIKFGDN